MVVCLCLGVAAIGRRDVVRHRRWMTRAYALAIAAGTQPLTLVPTLFAPANLQEVAYMLGMSAGWVINIAIAEWFLRRMPSHPSSASAALASERQSISQTAF